RAPAGERALPGRGEMEVNNGTCTMGHWWWSGGGIRCRSLEDTLKRWGDEAVLIDGPDLHAQGKQLVGDGALPYAFDAIGGSATARLAACVSPGGDVVNYGVLSGEPCQVSGVDLIFRGVSLRGFWVANWYQKTPRDEVARAFGEIINML